MTFGITNITDTDKMNQTVFDVVKAFELIWDPENAIANIHTYEDIDNTQIL